MKRKGRLSSKGNDTIITKTFDRHNQDYVWTVFNGAYEEDGRTVYKRCAQFQTWVYGDKRAKRLADRLHYRLTYRQMSWDEALNSATTDRDLWSSGDINLDQENAIACRHRTTSGSSFQYWWKHEPE
jgi:hypothetical protein